MSIDRNDDYILSLIKELIKQPQETEWIEFKHNNYEPQMIGEYISALSNSAALYRKLMPICCGELKMQLTKL